MSKRRLPVVLWFVAALLMAGNAHAHHILGIPHYKYGDDYPQIPFAEVLAQTPYTDIYFTYFPGTPRPGAEVRFKLYAKSRTSGEPVRVPLKVEVLRKRFLLSDELVRGEFEVRTGVGPEGNDYKFFLTFPAAEAYLVRVHFPDEGGLEVINFPISIGETDDRPVLFGAFGTLVGAVAIVAVLKRRRNQPVGRRKRSPR